MRVLLGSPGPRATAFLTALAMLAFAANSLLARLALGEGDIDPLSYTALRLATGAAMLWLVASAVRAGRADGGGRADRTPGDGAAALFLAFYAIAFSYAFVTLPAGTGALLLFGTVQATMIARGLAEGERPHVRECLGLILALGGLMWLVSPGLASPDPVGAACMVIAGVGWGGYSLRGRGDEDPVDRTAGNFLRTLGISAVLLPPLGFALVTGGVLQIRLTPAGALWATLSGAITSGLGYVIWYAALAGLTATRAAIVQLCVPVLAALAGVLVLGESLTPRLVLSGAIIMGGVALAVTTPRE